MDWLPLVPPFFAICLLLFGPVTRGFIRSRIEEFVESRQKLKEEQEIIEAIAVSWEATSSYFGTLFTLIIALVAIELHQGDRWLFVVNFLFLFMVLYVSMWSIFGLKPHELETRLTLPIFGKKRSYATICTAVLIAGNTIILGLTGYSEYTKSVEVSGHTTHAAMSHGDPAPP